MVQLFDGLQRIGFAHWAGAVDRLVAQLLYDPGLLEYGLRQQVLEAGLVQ